jgi:hypothetical protein
MSLLRVFATCIVVCVFSVLQIQAQKATCTNWNIWSLNPVNPSNPAPFAADVNDNRTVVGFATFSGGKSWGFVHYSSGKVTYWKPADAYYSDFSGRNNWGNTVGNYEDTLNVHHAVYFHGSTTTMIVHPKAAHHDTFVTDINNLNTILGKYWDSNGVSHIFKRRSDGTFLSVPSFPGASDTTPRAFNDNGVVVGSYILANDLNPHGFIYRNGSVATLNYRNDKQVSTELTGIDNNGVVVGNHNHLGFGTGFLYRNGVFKDIFGPNGERVEVGGISANGVITGDDGRRGFTVRCQ